MRAHRAARPLAAALFIVAACGAPGSSPAGSAGASAAAIPPVGPAALEYTCGQFRFTSALLAQPHTDELANDPVAAALRAHRARPEMDIDWLPDSGWTLIGRDDRGAEYLANGGDEGLYSVVLTAEGGAWRVTGWGGCQPMRVLRAGLGEASWTYAPGQDVGPGTTLFEALVTERDCASGRSSVGRVVGPDILVLADQVLVTFAVRPLGGGAQTTQTCQGNPAPPVTVALPEPLANRALLDGSTLPPRDPRGDL